MGREELRGRVCYPAPIVTTSTPARALALDLLHADTGLLAGVALLLSRQRYAAILIEGEQVEQRALSHEHWRAIDAWTATSDAALPRRPAPLDDAVVSALLPQKDVPMVAQRFASFPLEAASAESPAALAGRALPGFLISRRTAT